MTLNEKLSEIEQQFGYWIGNYSRGELVGNPVRIIAEAICKSIILHTKGDTAGTVIIEGNNAVIPKNRDIGNSLGQDLQFTELIKATRDVNGFRRTRGMSQHLDLIRVLTNPGSHSVNNSSDTLKPESMETLYNSISTLLRWLYTEKLQRALPTAIFDALQNPSNFQDVHGDDIMWNDFLSLCRDFQYRHQYILVSPETLSKEPHIADAIARLPWRLVLDFNPKTDVEENGLLYNFVKIKGVGYKKSFTIQDKLDFDPKFDRYWFLTNGQGTLQSFTKFSDWRKKYKRYLSESLYSAFNKGSRPQPRIVVLLNIDPDYANAIIDEFNAVDDANLEFIICNDGSFSYDAILSSYSNVKYIAISLEQLARGINNNIAFSFEETGQHQILIPYKNEKQVKSFARFKLEDYEYLISLGIELIYKGIEKEEKDLYSADEFYKGGMISWTDLAEEKDIIRNSYEGLSKRLKAELERNKTQEIELVHEAGAGGTTVARRLAYDFCDSYPTVILKQYEPKKTITGLRVIYDHYTNSSLPLLIILELFELKGSSQLYRDLGHANKNAVILVVKRGSLQNVQGNKFSLRAQLDLNEISLFENQFSLLAPAKKPLIYAIKQDYRSTPKHISPFLYGLVTYEREFKGLEGYIKKCIIDLNAEQRKLLVFVCLIYHFTQRAVPGEFFTGLFSTTRENCDLPSLLGEQNPIFEILHEAYDGHDGYNMWRPRYAILGEETMKVLLAGENGHKENWHTFLGLWLIELVKYVKMAMPDLHEEAKVVFDSLFISRGDYDGNEDHQFTDAIRALTPTAGVAVFERLTNEYPDEAHFHGHFARYLYKPNIGIRDYDRAIIEANRSLEIQENDSTLVHTLGMCYKEKAERLIETYRTTASDVENIEEHVKELVELACEAFDRAINLDDHNVYGHVSQSRLLLKTLDFGFKLHSGTSKEGFISDPANDWYANLLDKVGNLLEDATYIIDQSKGLDNKFRIQRSAGYVKDCEGWYLIEMGQSLVAKSRYEHLIKNTPAGYQYMVPRYRSLFIRSLLASKSEHSGGYAYAWEKLSESELMQSVEYLKQNTFDDPSNSHNIRLWLQAVRYLKFPPSIEECIGQIAMWCQITNQHSNSLLEGLYYLYVLNAVKAISSGEGFDPTGIQNVKEIKERMKGLAKNEKFSFEWYGNGTGIQQLKNHRMLGEFNTTNFFTRNSEVLVEVTGRIKEATNLQSGTIMLDCGLEAFFVPVIGNFTERNINDRVKFYVGFRYDQINAWEVVPIDYVRPDISLEVAGDDDDEFEEVQVEDSSLTFGYPKGPISASTGREHLLPGIKILGKIELPTSVQNGNKKAAVSPPTAPSVDNMYQGTIIKLNHPMGLIETMGIDRKVSFHVSHLRNRPFHKLRIGQKVSFKLIFENGVPKLDRVGKNYTVKEVRVL